MIQEKRQICKACATGNEKLTHNGDLKTCIQGRSEYIKTLSPKEQIEQLIIHERIPRDLADYITALALERNKTPMEIVHEEGMNLL